MIKFLRNLNHVGQLLRTKLVNRSLNRFSNSTLTSKLVTRHYLRHMLTGLYKCSIRQDRTDNVNLSNNITVGNHSTLERHGHRLNVNRQIAGQVLSRRLGHANDLTINYNEAIGNNRYKLLSVQLNQINSDTLNRFIKNQGLRQLNLITIMILSLHPRFVTDKSKLNMQAQHDTTASSTNS